MIYKVAHKQCDKFMYSLEKGKNYLEKSQTPNILASRKLQIHLNWAPTALRTYGNTYCFLQMQPSD